MTRTVPEELRERKFCIGANGLCATELGTGQVVEFQTFGEQNPALWSLSLIEYISRALPALESADVVLTPMPFSHEGTVEFSITPRWSGWGRQTVDSSGRRVFTLFTGGGS